MKFTNLTIAFDFFKFVYINKYTFLLSILLAVCVCSTSAYTMEWPVLDSADPQKPLHKTIISSIFGRPGEEYRGGKFKGNFFVLQGNGIDQHQNCVLIQHLPRLRILLQQGNDLKLSHVGTTDEVAHFSKHVLYQIALNDQVLPFQFSLYNKGKLNNFTPFTIPDQENTPILAHVSHPHQSQQLIEGIAAVRVGHGIWNFEAPPSQHIERLIKEYKDHNILGKAFSIIEGADLAVAYDQKVLLNAIRAYPNNTINMDKLFDLMRKDRDLITQAANAFNPDEVSKALPFLDQLDTLGSQGTLCGESYKGYKGRKGIDEAINYIQNNPELLTGVVSDKLGKLTGKNAINLRIALFYIAIAKKKAAGESFGPANLTTFYKGSYFDFGQNIKDLLSQTSFYQNGCFYTPHNGYVKNADLAINVPNDFEGLDLLVGHGRNLNNLQMVFTDCSGFLQQVVRQFHPTNECLQHRVMSYHLSALYDALANEKKGTTNILYDLYGNNSRPLKEHEREKVTTHSEIIRQLKSVYEPVLNPMQNIRSGDILVERSADVNVEGHVMIVVAQDSHNPSRLTIIELTCGSMRGYTWSDLDLSNNTEDRFHRVLRIKSQ